jgi:predicted signal transduction protein with EAL and GGDEF domain
LFQERLERELNRVRGSEQIALLYIDIDEFKSVSDSLGHPIGDELLKAVASCLSSCIRETDLIARLGGRRICDRSENADLALHGAKADGRRTHRFFEPGMDARAKARLTLERDLRQTMIDGSFEVQYQPVVNLGSNEVTGCEALLRWRHPERGMVSPAEIIPVAEDTGLISQLGE